MTRHDYGSATDPLSAPSLSAWAAAIAADLDAVDDALTAAQRAYHYVKAPAVADVPADVWTPVATLTAPDLPAGVYEIGWSVTWQLNSTVQSAMFRATYNGFASQYAAETGRPVKRGPVGVHVPRGSRGRHIHAGVRRDEGGRHGHHVGGLLRPVGEAAPMRAEGL